MRGIMKKNLSVLLGSTIMAISLNLFLIPANIAPGGLSGVSIILNHLFRIPVGLSIMILNIPIFLWGFRHFDAKFIIFSFVGMTALSILTDSFSWLKPVTEDILLSAVYGGILMGFGLGLVFNAGSTTGGTDIAAQILKIHFPAISVGRFILIIDAFIIITAGLIFGKWEVTLYSAVALYLSTYIIDLMAEGIEFAKVAYIISDNPKLISDTISSTLVRGTTALRAFSHYSGTEKTVLMCVVKKQQISQLKKIIKSIDPAAFVILSDTREVLGNGFNKH